MPVTVIRVRTDGVLYLVITPPTVKLRSPETGEIAKQRDTGQTLYVIQLAESVEGRAHLLKVTIPENGLPKNLATGQSVTPLNLTATPWARLFTPDQLSEGVVYRADALEVLK